MAIENGVLLLEHVKVVQQTRELIGAIRHAAAKNELSEEIAQQTRSEIKAICGTPHAARQGSEKLSQQEALATLLVLADVEEPRCLDSLDSKDVHQLIDAIREKFYAPSQLPLMILVYSQSIHQAVEVRKICLKVAESLLDTENCFSMYRMADFSTLPQLRHACLLTILQNFTQAVEADSSAFCNLQYNQLSQVIENDHVEVSNEMEVFEAIAKWIDTDKNSRKPHLCSLLERGVRLELMGPDSLAEVDAHRLVVEDQEASGIVAKAYLQCCYGSVILGEPRQLRHRKNLPEPDVEEASENVSSASCNPSEDSDGTSVRRASHFTSPQGAKNAGTSSEAAVAMSRVKTVQKRKRQEFSPLSAITPAMRFARGYNAERMNHSSTTPPIGEKLQSRCLPSKRRLF